MLLSATPNRPPPPTFSQTLTPKKVSLIMGDFCIEPPPPCLKNPPVHPPAYIQDITKHDYITKPVSLSEITPPTPIGSPTPGS